jgi:hypothetical protein
LHNVCCHCALSPVQRCHGKGWQSHNFSWSGSQASAWVHSILSSCFTTHSSWNKTSSGIGSIICGIALRQSKCFCSGISHSCLLLSSSLASNLASRASRVCSSLVVALATLFLVVAAAVVPWKKGKQLLPLPPNRLPAVALPMKDSLLLYANKSPTPTRRAAPSTRK